MVDGDKSEGSPRSLAGVAKRVGELGHASVSRKNDSDGGTAYGPNCSL